jgi:hypothetical protein
MFFGFCPKKNLENEFSLFSVNDHYQCNQERNLETNFNECVISKVMFCVGNEKVKCVGWISIIGLYLTRTLTFVSSSFLRQPITIIYKTLIF